MWLKGYALNLFRLAAAGADLLPYEQFRSDCQTESFSFQVFPFSRLDKIKFFNIFKFLSCLCLFTSNGHAMFSVKLDDIPEEGLKLSWEEEQGSLRDYLSRLSPVDFDFEGPLRAEAKIQKVGKSYLILGNVETALRLRCARCLKEFSYPLSSSLDLTLHPLKSGSSGEEVELGEDDMKSSFFEGGEIRLSEVACEQVFLEVPYQPLCREECKGLCPKCGQDLNLSPCNCTQEDLGAGFSALRNLKLDPS